MAVHSFTLILDMDYAADEQMDAVAEAGDDMMLCSSDGSAFVEVDREADSLDDALHSAIADVERVLPGFQVVRVEMDREDLHLTTAA